MSILAIARPRSAVLAPFVASLHLAGDVMPQALERVLPNGVVNLMFNLHEDEFRTYADDGSVQRTTGAVLVGPHARATIIDTSQQRRVLMVDFRPGGAAAFLPSGLGETRDQIVDLDRLWARDGAVLRERLLEAPHTSAAMFEVVESFLCQRLTGLRRPDPLIPFAMTALEHGSPVAEAASRAGLLPKAFTRRFQAGTGLPPKLYARVLRLQRVVASIGDPQAADWAGVAADHGYTDQAHLIHDFRDLTGLTPARYRPRSAAEHNHVPVLAAQPRR